MSTGWRRWRLSTTIPKHRRPRGDVDFYVENKGKENLYTNIYTLDLRGEASYTDIVNKLSEYANIRGIRTRNV